MTVRNVSGYIVITRAILIRVSVLLYVPLKLPFVFIKLVLPQIINFITLNQGQYP